MMRLTKRALSAFLAFVMVFTMLPLQSWAADTVQDSSNNAVNFGDMVVPNSVEDPEEKKVDTYQFYNDDTLVSTQYVMSGDQVYAPASPEIDGYKFTGWKDASGNFFTAGAVKTATGATYTYKAQFEQVYYVFFLNKEGAVCATKEGTTGTSVTTDVTFPVGTDEGISGWYYNAELTEPTNGSVTIKSSNITLYPKVETGHWITFDSAGGTYVEPAFVAPGANTVEPAKPEREGFDFLGWYDGDTEYIFDNTLSESVTLTAKWQGRQVEYKVFYWKENADNDEYSLDKMETMQDTAGEETEAGAYYNAGDGFHLSDDPGKQLVQKTIEGDGSTIVNVYYDRNVYTINFYTRNAQGQVICGKKEHHHSGWEGCYDWWGNLTCGKEEHTHTDACYSDAILATITAKYEAFIGDKWPTNDVGGNNWSTNRDGSSPWQANIQTMPLNGDNFYVPSSGSGSKRSKATYYVEVLDGEDGISVSGSRLGFKVHHSDTVNYSGLTVSEEDRYPLVGFTLITGSPSSRVGDTYNGAKFYYTRNDYTLTFVNLGSSSSETVQYQADISGYGEEPDRPAGIPSNYEFQGWYLDQAFQTKYDFAGKTMPAQNITVYAKWAAPEVTVTVHLEMEGSESPVTLPLTYGTSIDEATLDAYKPNLDENEYTWHGWATREGENYKPFNFDTKLTQDITLYPYYTSKKAFTVVYNVNDGSSEITDGRTYKDRAYADVKYANGVAAPADKVFLGWNTASDGSGHMYQPGDKLLIDSKNANAENQITLYAQWGDKAGKAILIYNANGGNGTAEPETCDNNERVQLKSAEELNFVKEGYKFLGWSANPEATKPTYQAGTSYIVNNKNTSDGVNTLYAVWEQQFKVTYTFDGTAPKDAQLPSDSNSYSEGDPVKILQPNSVDNYEFLGWKNENGNPVAGTMTMPDHNVTLTGSWKPLTAQYTIHHYWEGTTESVREDIVGTKNIGEVLTVSPTAVEGYTATSGEQSISITADEAANVITFYYKKNVTITVDDATKQYGEVDPKFTGTVVGVDERYPLGEVSYSRIDADKNVNVGNYPDTITATYTPNSRYHVTVIPGDFSITVNTSEVVVTITENSATETYDGSEKSVTGYTVKSISNELYKETDFTFTGKAEARGTNQGYYPMEVKEADFTNNNKNFSNVKFEIVEEGGLTIEPKPITLTAKSVDISYGDPIPALWIKEDLNTLLVPGDTINFRLDTKPMMDSQNNPLVGTYPIEFVGKKEEQGNYLITFVDGTLTVKAPEGYPHVVKTHTGEPLFPGDEVQFAITVKNIYNETAAVTITELPEVTFDDVTGVELAPGETNTFYATYKVTEEDILAGSFTNVATYTLTVGQNQITGTAENMVPLNANPKMTVDKVITSKDEDGNGKYDLNETIRYQITIRNDGNVTLTNVIVKDFFGMVEDSSFVDITDQLNAAPDFDGTLQPKESVTFTYDYQVKEADLGKTVSNQASATTSYRVSDQDDPNAPCGMLTGEKTVTCLTEEPNPSLQVHKSVDNEKEVYKVDDVINYTITVTNDGNVTMENVNVEDVLVDADGKEVWQIDLGEAATFNLKPGESETIHCSYTVREEDLGKTLVNTATATAENPVDPDKPVTDDDETDGEKVEDPNPSVDLDKRITNQQATYKVGQTITYQIVVKNNGNTTLHDLVLTDDLINSDGTVTFTDLGGGTLSGGEAHLASLAPGAQWTVTCRYVVRAADESQSIANYAEVISHDPQTGEPDAVADDTTEQVEVEARYTLTIRYENQARQQIHGSYVTRLSAGDQYSVTSPAVAGYYLTENAKVISGTMPAEDRTIVVIYAAVPGPDGGDEDDETTEATEATEEPPVDPGAYTEDPDDYTLTPITDEETPLANLDEEHTCCILHFLVMLAAMVVLGFYTGSKKKHQARIFELKRTLAKEQDLPEQDDPEHP